MSPTKGDLLKVKLLVFSDSHGTSLPMREAFSRCRPVDYAVHAGDGADDLFSLAKEFNATPVAVRGNCDFGSPLPLEAELTVDEIRILIVHGHRYNVKFSPMSLVAEARRRGIDLVIFGHTHIKLEKYVSDDGERPVYLFNPGCVRGGDFGVIDIRGKSVLLSHGNVYDGEA